MPPQGIWDIDWWNENSQRKYPLHEDAGCQDTTLSFTLPNDFLVDLILPSHVDLTLDTGKFHIINVTIFGTGVTVAIGYNGTAIGSATIDVASFTKYATYFITCTGDFADSVGKLVIGSLDTILKYAGSFQFDLSNGRLVPTVIKPDIRGVSAIYLKNGTDVSAPIQGDVILQAGRNFLIQLVPATIAGEPDRIVLNAIEGEGLSQTCGCDDNANLPCIKTINGIGPDPSGNFTMLHDDCLELDAIANGLKLVDKCANPCCGCEELKVVNDTLELMISQVTSLENLAGRLEASLLATQTNLASYRLGKLP